MNIEQVISSGLLESYVLGHTTAEETLMVTELCAKHPELLTEIEQIEAALLSYSSQQAPPLRRELKADIAGALGLDPVAGPAREEKPQAAVIPIQRPAASTPWYYKVGLAASLALLVASGFYIYSMQQKILKAQGDMDKVIAASVSMQTEMDEQKNAMEKLAANFRVVSDPEMKAIPLKGMNSLATRSAMVHWNPDTHELYFNATSLPASPQEKQYQLWAIVDGKPVDAGVISLENGITFQKMKLIAGAKAFAVTIEKMGGSESPTLDTMCLLGNV